MILEGARTPVGKFLGSFAETGGRARRGRRAEAMRRANVDAEDVDQTIVGHARQAGNGPNTGRQVSIRAGVPEEVAAFNVNMACGSGMKAVQLARSRSRWATRRSSSPAGWRTCPRPVPPRPDADRLPDGERDGDDAMYRDGLLDPCAVS